MQRIFKAIYILKCSETNTQHESQPLSNSEKEEKIPWKMVNFDMSALKIVRK